MVTMPLMRGKGFRYNKSSVSRCVFYDYYWYGVMYSRYMVPGRWSMMMKHSRSLFVFFLFFLLLLLKVQILPTPFFFCLLHSIFYTVKVYSFFFMVLWWSERPNTAPSLCDLLPRFYLAHSLENRCAKSFVVQPPAAPPYPAPPSNPFEGSYLWRYWPNRGHIPGVLNI